MGPRTAARRPGWGTRDLLDLIAADHPNPALLEVGSGHDLVLLGVDSIVVADAGGAEPVGITDLLAADADPFCELESAWLRHLDSDHPEVIARLAGKLPAVLRRGRVRPLGLDRYGCGYGSRGRCRRWGRPRRPPAVPRAGARHHRVGPGDPAVDGLPFVNGLRAAAVAAASQAGRYRGGVSAPPRIRSSRTGGECASRSASCWPSPSGSAQ